jgi:curved DNA-binding protein CbpA
MAVAQKDYYELLQVPPSASRDEIEAAYAKLHELYNPERMAAGPEEFQDLARRRRDELLAAYEVLRDPERRSDYDREQRGEVVPLPVLDYRPLPPAQRRERPSPSLPLPVVEPEARARPRRGRRSLVTPLIVGSLMLGVLLLLVLSGVRTRGGAAALATPAIPDLNLPFPPEEVQAARTRAETTNSAEAWTAYGNVLFDNIESIRERAPLAPQYLNQLEQWRDAARAYSRALELGAKADVRSDMALSLFYHGLGTNDQAEIRLATTEVERAYKEAPEDPRTLLNYGLIMSGVNPPRDEEARTAWKRLTEVAPESPLARRARDLLAAYGQ